MSDRPDRRDFIKRAALTTAGATLGLHASPRAGSQSGASIYDRLVQANDARVSPDAQRQGGPGGFSARGTANHLQMCAAAYCAPESRYHRSPALVRQMEEAADALLRAQHADGTIDSGNLQSPPDTAFVVEPIALTFTNLDRNDSAEVVRLKERLKTFLLAAGEALTVGGVHTPNHRWGVCAALARINALLPAARYVHRIDEWLSEGIDIDDDGQFSERSVGNYSSVTNIWLIVLARLLDREALLEPVRRNLELTMYHMHPDGELEAIASRRQDQWRRNYVHSARPVPDNFHLCYRYLALRDGDGRFSAMTRLIEETAGDGLAPNLGYFLEDPLLKDALPAETPLPSDYARFFPGSGLVRIRRGQVSASIYGGSDYPRGVASGLASNPTFFTFRHGDAVLESIRMTPHFFRKGFFYSDGVQVRDNRYLLHQRVEVPYYQPLPRHARTVDGDYELTPAEDRFWAKMSFPGRQVSEVKALEQHVTITEPQRGRFEIAIAVSGHDGVPVTVELAFRRGGRLTGVTSSQESGDEFFLEQGTGRYEMGRDVIEFGPGRADHRRTRMEGEIFDMYNGSIRPDALRVYITGTTPFHETITLG